jgi:predicted RNA polymerase sigma factor
VTHHSTSGEGAEQSSSPLLEHLFRRQAGRIVSCLAGLLGSQHLQLAEDAVQEAMLRAAQSWPFNAPPENPEAWLLTVARNYSITALRRDMNFDSKTTLNSSRASKIRHSTLAK